MNKILIASGNTHKIKEFSKIFQGTGVIVEDPKSLALCVPEPAETGADFIENASIKARAYLDAYPGAILADDSGLVVPLLAGEPGLRSARYAGEGATDHQNRQKLIGRLKSRGVVQTPAYFVCALVWIDENRKERAFFARWEGDVRVEESGKRGFGYDPLFYLPHKGKSAAELEEREKNKISHRGQALRKLRMALL